MTRRPALFYATGWGTWLYLGGAAGAWLLLTLGGERWWPGTLLLFGPRWLLLVPLVVLVPLALLRPRLLAPLGAAAAVVLGPVMGLCVPWRAFLGGKPTGATQLRVLTCNVDGTNLNAPALGTLLAVTMPDVVALQEWATGQEQAVFWQQEWHVRSTPEGLCLASRFPVRGWRALPADRLGLPGGGLRCDLETPDGVLRVVTLHLPTPRVGLEAVLSERLRGVTELEANTERRWHASAVAGRWVREGGTPALLAGDFNMPADSAVYRTYWSGYANAFSAAGWGWGPTKFTRLIGVRIDHVLAGDGWRCRRCWVGPDVGSDHRPVLADLEGPTRPGQGGRP